MSQPRDSHGRFRIARWRHWKAIAAILGACLVIGLMWYGYAA